MSTGSAAPEGSPRSSPGSEVAPDGPVGPARPNMTGVARGGSANLLGAVVMAFSTFALTLTVTRGLSVETAGVLFAATSAFLLATALGQLGTNTGLVFFLSSLRPLGRSREIPAFYRTAIRPVAVVALLMAVVMYVAAEPLATLIVPGREEEATAYIRVLALFIPFAGWENVTLAATRGLTTMRPTVLVEQFFRSLLQLVAVAAAVHLAPSSAMLALAWAGPYLPAAVMSYFWWRRVSRRAIRNGATPAATTAPRAAPPTDTVERSTARAFWGFTAPRAVASVGQMAMQRLDIVLIAALAGPAQAAIYTATTRFLVVGQMGNRAISTAVQPRLGESLARQALDEAKHYYRVSTAWLMVITWPLYLSFIVFGSTLLTVFGRDYRSGGDVLHLLSVTMLVATGCGMVDMVLNMAGKTSWNLWNVLLSVGVQLSLCLVLIPRYGILGAAIAWGAAILTSNLVPLTQIALTFGLHPFGRAPMAAAALAVTCYLGVGSVGRVVLGTTVSATVMTLVSATALYVLGLWLLREPLELAALRSVRRRGRVTPSEAAPQASVPDAR